MHVSAVCFVMPWLMRTINQKENINMANMYGTEKRGSRNRIASRERERIIKKVDLWWHGSWMSEVIPLEQAIALRSYFTVAGGHLAHPLKGGAEAVKPGANFLDNPRGKACSDLSLTQSRPSLRWDCFECR